MELLKAHPQFDYAVLRSVFTNNEDIGMMVHTDPASRARFRAHRDRAMTTGNRESVELICEYILWDFEVRKSTDFIYAKGTRADQQGVWVSRSSKSLSKYWAGFALNSLVVAC